MATTLANINDLVNDRRRDSTSNSIDMTTDGFRAINSTLDLWQQLHDWEFTIERQIINYNEGITTYNLNSDFKAPIDLRPQKGSKRTEFDMISQNTFDSDQIHDRTFAMHSLGQIRRIRIKHAGDKAQIHTATSFDANGTWVASGDASNVTTDSNEFFDLNASVNFDITAGTSGILTNSTFTAVDISKFESRGNVYFNVFFPTVTNLTSVTLKFGSDASNYFTETITTDHLGDAFAVGWNRLKADFDTTVGSPDSSAIDFLEVTITYSLSTTDTDFRIENFFVSEDVPLIFEYYSLNMVQDAADSTKRANFDNSASTTDTFLWSDEWDYVKESFVNSVLEIIFFMTGEYVDRSIAEQKIAAIVGDLRRKLPGRRRYPTMAVTVDINTDGPPNPVSGRHHHHHHTT